MSPESQKNGSQRLWGKYRGTVVDNNDPSRMARVKAAVADVSDAESAWAMPCVPFAGALDQYDALFVLPEVGANVWIEFEQGDVSRPIWTGRFWDEREAPPRTASDPEITLAAGRSRIAITEKGITIEAPSITVKSRGQLTLDAAANAKVEAGAELELRGSGQVKVVGSLIKLN